jgi:DNA-directed RNA polymerase specialized sigma24 family protein
LETKRNISNHEILADYIVFMNRTARKFFPSNSLAKDVASDVYLKLFDYPTNKLMTMIYQGKLESFIYIVIRNHVEDLRRIQKNRLMAESLSFETGIEIDFSDVSSKLSKLTEDELKFLSIFVTVDNKIDMTRKYNLSMRYVDEMLTSIKNKTK